MSWLGKDTMVEQRPVPSGSRSEALCKHLRPTGHTTCGEGGPSMMSDVTGPCQSCESEDGSTSGSVPVSKMQPVA